MGSAPLNTNGRLDLGMPRRGQSVRVAAVAVAVTFVVGVGFIRLTDDDDRSAVVTSSSPTTHVDGEASGTYGLGTGWHDLDPGPLAPRQGAAVTWTGEEVIVLGGERHRDGAAYDPAAREWRTIADPPLPDGVVHITWTGNELVAVESRWSEHLPAQSAPGTPGEGALERVAAAYDPATDRWRRVAGAPDADATNLDGLIWTGNEVILLDALAAYDPVTDRWRDLELPSALVGGGPLAGGWAGDAIVLAGYGAPAVTHDPIEGTTEVLVEPPRHGLNVVATQVAAQTVGGTYVLVDDQGRASALDLQTGTWQEEASLEIAGGACIPRGFGLTGNWSVWDLCASLWLRSPQGTWNRADESGQGCCYPHTTTSGAVLFRWTSNDDTANDRNAPHRRFKIWVPTEETDPADDPESGLSPELEDGGRIEARGQAGTMAWSIIATSGGPNGRCWILTNAVAVSPPQCGMPEPLGAEVETLLTDAAVWGRALPGIDRVTVHYTDGSAIDATLTPATTDDSSFYVVRTTPGAFIDRVSAYHASGSVIAELPIGSAPCLDEACSP